MRYPSDNNPLVLFLRFCNVMDPDNNELSPVRIQAWFSTINAGADLLTHQPILQTGLGLGWAAMSHIVHQVDKNNRAKNLKLLGG